jgi:uncharacterized iron-regulated membrane protein
MRQFHRWTAVIFAIFMLWIAATGVISYFGELGRGEGPPRGGRAAAVSQVDPGFACPSDMLCIPRRAFEGGGGNWVGLMHHLHSGEAFGPAGMVIGFLSGLALLFFAFSGLWMYARMWSDRKTRGAKPKWFWK